MMVKRLRAVSILTVLALALMPVHGYCLPEGEVQTQGTVTFDRTVTDQFTVNQASARAIIDYTAFNIAAPETVTFNQPDSSSIALNRIAAGNPSSILGKLTANGRVFLLNPSGITFGANSQVDTAGLLASTLSMTTSDASFMNPATSSFEFAGTGTNAVVNQGIITALGKPGGFVALLGARVLNDQGATIVADTGTIALASGNAMTLSLDAANLINVVVSDPASLTSSQVGVVNNGALLAESGKVLVNAKVLDTVLNQAVNNSGVIQAQGITITANGDIVISEGSMIKASAEEGDAEVVIRAGDYSEVTDDDTYDFIQNLHGSSSITVNGSYIGAEASSGEAGFAESLVEIMAKNVSIDTSWVTSQVSGSGQAQVNVSAGDYDRFEVFGESLDEIFSGGDLEISGTTLEARVDGPINNGFDWDSQRASVNLEASNMLLDLAYVVANRADSGTAEIGIKAGNYIYHSDEDYEADSLNGGFVDIIDGSSLLAEVSKGWGTAGIDIQAGKDVVVEEDEGPKCITVEDSTINANVFGSGSGTAYVSMSSGDYMTSTLWDKDNTPFETFFGDTISLYNSCITAEVGNGWAYAEFYGRDFVSDNSAVTAIVSGNGEVAGKGDAEIDIIMSECYDDQNGDVTSSGGSIDIMNGSSLLAGTDNGDAEIFLETGGSFGAEWETYIDIDNSAVNALVDGSGFAGIYMYDEYGTTDTLQDIVDFLGADWDMGGAIAGPITITDSTIRSENASSENEAAVVYMNTDSDINIIRTSDPDVINVSVTAEADRGAAGIALLAGNDINLSADTYVSAYSEYNSAGVVAAAGNSINAADAYFYAESYYDGVGAVALLALNNIAANVYASGEWNIIPEALDLINGWIGGDDPDQALWFDTDKFSASSFAFLSTLYGDITLGSVSADAVLAAALGYTSGLSGNIFSDGGIVNANILGLLARGTIGTAEAPIDTNVNMVTAYSYDRGDIYLNQIDYNRPIELGIYLPIYLETVDKGKEIDGGSESPFIEIGASIAANDGIVHITSEGDMIVNSILAPRGGVFLESAKGNIYAGHGWCPLVSQESIDSIAELATNPVNELFGWDMDESQVSDYISDFMMDVSFIPTDDIEGDDLEFMSPVMGGFILGANLVPSANVWATGYSYFSAPNGKIGADPSDDPALQGAIKGIVRSAGSEQPGFDLVPDSGYVLYQDIDTDEYGPLPGYGLAVNGAPVKIWSYSDSPSSWSDPVNPLEVVIQLVEGSKSAAPALGGEGKAFTPVAGLTLNYNSVYVSPVKPLNPASPDSSSQLAAPLSKTYRAYYEVLNAHRFVSVEPATPTTFFGYHPLTPMDMEAFNGMALDEGMYDFISDNIKPKKPLSPYLQ
jgi:filamentous hemagglutinin family protein